MSSESRLDVQEWFDKYVNLNKYTVDYKYIHTEDTVSCTIFIFDKHGYPVYTSTSLELPTEKAALRHAKFIYYSKYHTNIITRIPAMRIDPVVSVKTIPVFDKKCFNIVDAECVARPEETVNFNGPIVYFCTILSCGFVKHKCYDIIDCLDEFEITKDINICILDDSMSELVDHYISSCAINIIRYCVMNDIKTITFSSVDNSARCTIYTMRKYIRNKNLDIQVYLLGRYIY